MQRIYVGGLVLLLNSLLAALIVSAVGDLTSDGGSTSTETPALTNKKFEERAPAGELHNISSRSLPARPKPKAERGDMTVFSRARRGGIWNHDGSIVRLEAVGRARRFLYVEVRGGLPAKGGDIAFEGIREGPTYSGRAFQFAENCAPLAYLVKGSVSSDESTVKMVGRKPQRDSQCSIVSYVNEELVFSLKL